MVTGVAVRGPIGEGVYPDLVIDYTIDVDCLLISPKPDHPISPWFGTSKVGQKHELKRITQNTGSLK